MLFAADGEFDEPSRAGIRQSDSGLDVVDGDVIEAQPAALDLPARLARRRGQSRQMSECGECDAGGKLVARDLEGGQSFRECALLEGAPGSLGRLFGQSATVTKRRRLGG